ncbi:aa3-type cytochrome oxidase subunit II [Kineococcus sp. SYSU DK004]|uniref:aa3-type cytochrome oxidase subunit II n=1 Tax=Kineococcus sp. SYSU DK004 TaxID=3383125 RepID=UPI003D7E4616
MGRPTLGTRDTGATPRRRPAKGLTAAAAAAAGTLLLGGCAAGDWPNASASNGFLPDASVGATDMTDRIQTLWNGSWIAALVVGLLVWGLTIWVVVAYRRRKGDPELPPQVRYNMPIEILYTIVPVMMVGVLFYYTAVDQAAITDRGDEETDVTVQVVGKKWSWDFNYLAADQETPLVWDTGVQAGNTADENVEDRLPVLYLPVDQKVRFELYARDVIHSFYVPAFLFKMDMIPGSPNEFIVTPTKEGFYQGKCAELCGEYHSEMLFNVAVVSEAEYQQHLQDLEAAGQTGALPTELGGALEGEGIDPGGDEANTGGNF